MSSTKVDSPSFATQIPPTSALVPVQTAPLPVVVAAPPKERMTLLKVRDFIAATDLDGTRPEHGGNRTWSTLNNGINAALATCLCIPGVAQAVAPFSICWGGIKLVAALANLGPIQGDSGVTRGLFVSGAKSMALGASAFLLPGVSEALNLVAAAKDSVDVLNAAVDRPAAKKD